MSRLSRLHPYRAHLAFAITLLPGVSLAESIPAGSILELRLRQEVNSYSSAQGSTIQAYLSAPVVVDGKIFLPMETVAIGRVRQVQRVGLGLIRERANLLIEFDQLVLPNGERYNVKTRVVEIENGRERVTATGKIQGIRSTNMPGYRASGVLVSIAAVDPIALAFSSTISAALLRFSEPEIRLPVGAELVARLVEPLQVETTFSDPTHKLHITDDERSALRLAIRRMPFRTHTRPQKTQTQKTVPVRDGDITNFVFTGTSEALLKAFNAAGWVESDRRSASSNYKALRSFAENQGYQQAPMSVLMLNGKLPTLSLSKAMNTFHKRHHIRIFESGQTWHGHPLFTASSTQDTAVVFAAKKFIHRIDNNIDNERAKVFNDLLLTRCVEEAETMDRAWVPKETKNATGETVTTDGKIAILRFNDCHNPSRFDEAIAAPPGPFHGNAASRISRQTFLTIRNDVVRGNLVYQSVSGVISGIRILKNKEPEERPERQTGITSPVFHPADSYTSSFAAPIGPAPPLQPPDENINPWDPPKVELSLDAGFLRFANKSTGAEGVQIIHRLPGPNGTMDPFIVVAENLVKSGYSFGGSATLNTQRWISHELGFHYQRGRFNLGLQSVTKTGSEDLPTVEVQDTGLLTRQFSYNTLVNLRPRESRWRPYVGAGPVLQLINLSDSPFKKARGLFRFGLNNVGIIQAAYNFGNAAPLEGGGIFQLGMQAGAGFKYRVAPRWTMHLDFRGTVSPSPDFLKKSLTQPNILPIADGDPQPKAAPVLQHGLLWQQRFTGGFSFTF